MSVLTPPANVGLPHLLFVALILPVGLLMLAGGIWLALLGGSLYYLLTGLAAVGCAVLLYRGRRAAVWLYAAMLAWTLAWSFWEVGLDFWGVAPRIAAPALVGLWLTLPPIWRSLR